MLRYIAFGAFFVFLSELGRYILCHIVAVPFITVLFFLFIVLILVLFVETDTRYLGRV